MTDNSPVQVVVEETRQDSSTIDSKPSPRSVTITESPLVTVEAPEARQDGDVAKEHSAALSPVKRSRSLNAGRRSRSRSPRHPSRSPKSKRSRSRSPRTKRRRSRSPNHRSKSRSPKPRRSPSRSPRVVRTAPNQPIAPQNSRGNFLQTPEISDSCDHKNEACTQRPSLSSPDALRKPANPEVDTADKNLAEGETSTVKRAQGSEENGTATEEAAKGGVTLESPGDSRTAVEGSNSKRASPPEKQLAGGRRRTGFSDALDKDNVKKTSPGSGLSPSSSQRDSTDAAKLTRGSSRASDATTVSSSRKLKSGRRTGFSDEPAHSDSVRKTGFSDGPTPLHSVQPRRSGFSDAPHGALKEMPRKTGFSDAPLHARPDTQRKKGFSDGPPMGGAMMLDRPMRSGGRGSSLRHGEKGGKGESGRKGGGKKGGYVDGKGGGTLLRGRVFVNGGKNGWEEPHIGMIGGQQTPDDLAFRPNRRFPSDLADEIHFRNRPGFSGVPTGRSEPPDMGYRDGRAGFPDAQHPEEHGYQPRRAFPDGARGDPSLAGGGGWRPGFAWERGFAGRHRPGILRADGLSKGEEEMHNRGRWPTGNSEMPTPHGGWGAGSHPPAPKDSKLIPDARPWPATNGNMNAFEETSEPFSGAWTDGKGRVLTSDMGFPPPDNRPLDGRALSRGGGPPGGGPESREAWREPGPQWEHQGSQGHGTPPSSNVAEAVKQGLAPMLPATNGNEELSMRPIGPLTAEEESVAEWYYVVPTSPGEIFGPVSITQLHEWEKHLPEHLPIWKMNEVMVVFTPGKRSTNGTSSSQRSSIQERAGSSFDEGMLEEGSGADAGRGDGSREPAEELTTPEDDPESYFRGQVTSIVKAALHPSWEKGQLTREIFKAVCKSAVEKVVMGHQGRHAFSNTAQVDSFLTSAQRTKVANLAKKCEKYYQEKQQLQ